MLSDDVLRLEEESMDGRSERRQSAYAVSVGRKLWASDSIPTAQERDWSSTPHLVGDTGPPKMVGCRKEERFPFVFIPVTAEF